jgi:phosphoadenosine phosphosulfate reductase
MATQALPATQVSTDELAQINLELEDESPQTVLEWALGRFHPDILLASSFGGISGMALLDMAVKINPDVRTYYLDTDFLFPETHALIDRTKTKYRITPMVVKSRWTPEKQAETFGDKLWERDPDLCCNLRKVEPNERALEGNSAWISGLRRDQSPTRRDTPIVEWDTKFELVKVNPLATWTEEQVWAYIRENDVPYNELHESGYPSIGCTHCTLAVKPGQDLRAGRWRGFTKSECGIHAGPGGNGVAPEGNAPA